MLFGSYAVVFNFIQTSTKNFLWLTFVLKCRFSVTSHALFLASSQPFFNIAVILVKRCFCKRGRRGLHFELLASDCANWTQQIHNSLFSNLTTLVSWKKYRLWEPWMTLLLLHPNNSIVCFNYHLHFLRCSQRSQLSPATKNVHPWKNKLFAEQKKCTSTLNKNHQFVY